MGNAGGVADVTLRVTEGTQYFFGAITLWWLQGYPREELLKAIGDETGKPFTRGRLDAAQRKLEDFFKRRGHFLVKIEASGDKMQARNGIVPVVFTLVPGPPHRFDGVTLRGLQRVKPRFVENRLMKLRGETYDPENDERFRQLQQTSLFKTLRINPQLAPGDQVRIDVEVEEAKPKEFAIGLGFASYEGVIASLSYTDRNCLRTSRPLTLGVEYTSRAYKGELLWSDPWLFESDYRFRARLYALTREEQGYSKIEYGLQPSLARNITKHWEFLIRARQTGEDHRVHGQAAGAGGPEKYTAISLGLSTTFDFRNNPANPTRGFIGTATFDVAPGGLGGDVEFVRATARFSYYLPITQKSVLAFGARGGVISPEGSARLPIDERFFSGGSTSVRSFVEELGPGLRMAGPLGVKRSPSSTLSTPSRFSAI